LPPPALNGGWIYSAEFCQLFKGMALIADAFQCSLLDMGKYPGIRKYEAGNKGMSNLAFRADNSLDAKVESAKRGLAVIAAVSAERNSTFRATTAPMKYRLQVKLN